MEAMNDGILIVSSENKISHYNSRFKEIFSIPDELLTLNEDGPVLNHVKECMDNPEEFLNHVVEIYNTNKKTEDILYMTNRHIIERFSFPLIEDSPIDGRVWLFRDITERKEIEEALLLSEKKFSTIFRESPIPFSLSDPETGRFIEVNEAFLHFIKAKSFSQIIGKTSLELGIVSIDERKKILDSISKKNRILNFEMNMTRLDGKSVIIDCNSVIYEFEEKLYLLVNHVDITRRREMEQLLKESEEKYRTAFNTSRDAISISNFQGEYIDINKAYTRLTGYSKKEAFNISAINIWASIEERKKFIDILVKNGWVENFETELRIKNKQRRIALISASFIKVNGEQNILSFTRDITESRNLQNALALNELKFRSIFTSSKDGIVIINKDLDILDANPAVYLKSHYFPADLLGKNIAKFLSDGLNYEAEQRLKKLFDGEAIENFETTIKINNDGGLPVEISATTMNINGEDSYLLLVRDISERKKLEKELLNSVINTEERERLNFSQELHDGLGPVISAAKMYVQWLAKPNANIERLEIMADIENLLDEASRSIREISFKLNPHILQNYGVVEAIKAFANKIIQSSIIEVAVNSNTELKIDSIKETIIYRILCECINNTLKHASASKITIDFDVDIDFLTVRYLDDGKGFNVEEAMSIRKGIGLLNMQSRLKSINGYFSIQSLPEKGTKITIRV